MSRASSTRADEPVPRAREAVPDREGSARPAGAGIVGGVNRTSTPINRPQVGVPERHTHPVGRRLWRRWPTWVPYAAAAWSLGYGLVALAWTLTGSGFPLGRNDSNGRMSLLAGLPAEIGAPVFAVVALAGAGVGVAMARVPRPATGVPRWCRRLAVGFGSVTAAVWVVIVPDARILALVGYLPMLIVLAPFDAKIRGDVVAALSAAHVNHIAVIAGGFLWAFATLVFARRTAGTCEYCGHGASRDRWTIPVAAARWAGYVAAVIPALYALTRLAWVAGIPLGVDEEFHATAQAAARSGLGPGWPSSP